MINQIIMRIFIVFLSLTLAGCTFILQKGRRSDIERIKELTRQLDEFEETKRVLEKMLKQEIADKQVRLERMDKGLVITFVADVLFDSGKAKIKENSYSILNKVARVLIENVPKNFIGIEGHTDNVPIKYSAWKSNWELSVGRALSVLHYLADKKNIPARRLSVIGYGEYRPVASNQTVQGRQLNRRVEVVIMPRLTKVKSAGEQKSLREPRENLK